jgi:pimeloyl-ACP methyl ester carboxylesterase
MAIETGVLSSRHPYARIGTGSRLVLSLPGLSFTAEPSTAKAVRRAWKAWLGPIDRHGLTFVEVGRRADLRPGSTAADVAADYAEVIRREWGTAVGVMGISTGGHYAQWLAIRHPELVDRLVLGFTAHRLTAETREIQRRVVDNLFAGRWRTGFALMAPWVFPKHPRLASAAGWLIGPYVSGRPKDLRVLAIDADADEGHDATKHLGEIRCPTLVVSGALDGAYPPDLVRELVAGVPGASHVEYPNTGHGGPGSRFADDACAFLGRMSPALGAVGRPTQDDGRPRGPDGT